MTIKRYTCDCCGGTLQSDGRCKYCGTLYKITPEWFEEPVHIVLEHPRVNTIMARVKVPKELLYYEKNPEKMMKYVMEQAARDLARKILEEGQFEMESQYEPRDQSENYLFRVRNIIPREDPRHAFLEKVSELLARNEVVLHKLDALEKKIVEGGR